MEFSIGTYAIALLAGALSTLSPCVLPLLPIIIGSSVAEHKAGPFVLAAGMALSFAMIGTMLASVGVSIGLNQNSFRFVAAIVMMLIGIVLISKNLQERFAVASSGISNAGNSLLAKVSIGGLKGQFVIGVLLGLVWSPCVGPTLGAVITIASQGSNLIKVALMMGVFGLGAALPIVILGLLSREAMLKAKLKLQGAGGIGKMILGTFLIVVGLAILSGQDKKVEEFLTVHSPEWLTELTTRF
ncbi:cytochrome c biogenesis CcdA family protein [Polynucleobacter sp. CS-Odin-A6]|uniref:cytochrome c biogenesis CcdA family protein n=1 Tax=Polynucleobacter sp. CS-Odin-A6 TaxID=2689106 RepID=UPI001C0D184A|nr:cytochrome c biogenesis CcdA family protein [Polynucleobacter sp. CS-Odin-A6]MBU3621993.1 cytochrome c biogenesis protein CcdA [Polynucleobacter sp. CS-Odin-A6]